MTRIKNQIVDPMPRKKNASFEGRTDPINLLNPCIILLGLGSLTQKALKGIDFTSMNQIKI
jgi:hypothetical protein